MKYRTVLINLKSRPDRLAQTEQECARMKIVFDILQAKPGGEIGCSRSHYKAITEGEPGNLLVLEDDVVFVENAEEIFLKAIEQLPDDWDFLYLGANVHSKQRAHSENLSRLSNAHCTHAVLYSQKARDFIKARFNPYRDPIFDEWARLILQPNLRGFLVTPMVALQRPGFSDIQNQETDYTKLMKANEIRHTEQPLPKDLPGAGLRILAQVHAYPPTNNAGAEWYLHSVLKYLVKRGFQVRVLTRKVGVAVLDGVQIFEQAPEIEYKLWNWADIGISALATVGRAHNNARSRKKKLFVILHNTFTNRNVEFDPSIGLIANADHCKEDCLKKKYQHQIEVIRPPVWVEDYQIESTKKREAITLVNLNENKGGVIFRRLADRMPERKFIGVLGGYGEQLVDEPAPDNVEYIPNGPDIKKIYSRTRVLIMPSKYESYGRVAVEAMAAGIPVIYSDTPGLREALGPVGIMVEQGTVAEGWMKAIKVLDVKHQYEEQVKLGIERAAALQEKSIKELESFINIIKKYE